MRVMPIAGAVLLALGLFLIIRPPSYTREESVFKVGDIEAKVQQEHPLPPWIGGAVLGAGCVLVVLSLKRSR